MKRDSGCRRVAVQTAQLPRSFAPCPIFDKGKRSVSVGEGGNRLIVETVRTARRSKKQAYLRGIEPTLIQQID
jgi:hypothetical protein